MHRIRVVDDVDAAGDLLTALYLRVTAEESVKTDLSLPNQRLRGLEICAERRWSPAKVYQEPRHVGGDQHPSRRPALKALLDDIEAGKVKRVLVRHDDRLWRSTEVQDLILNALRRNAVELWNFAGQRELRSAGGRFAIKVLGAAAELEKGLTGERIREMKRGKARAGRLGGGPPSFGYTSQSRVKLDALKQGLSEDEAHRQACEKYPIAKTWSIDEGEAEVVRLIFDLYLEERRGARRISEELNRRGYRRRAGFAWSPVKVGKVVNNPVVAGLTSYDEDAYEKGLPSRAPRYRQQLFPGQHPPIIPAERWHEAQQLKTEVNAKLIRTRSTPTARVYPLTGVLRCGKCGSPMSGKSSGGQRPAYYMCSRRKYYGRTDGCNGDTVHMPWTDKTVWEYLDRLLQAPGTVHAVMERANRALAEHAPEFQARLKDVHSATADLEAKQHRWMEKYEAAADDVAAEIIWKRIRELKNQELELRREAEDLDRRLANPSRKQLTLKETGVYLERLRQPSATSAVKRRAFIEKLRRFHDLRVRVLDPRRLAVTLRLDPNRMAGSEGGNAKEPIGQRLGILAKAGTKAGVPRNMRPMYPGKPEPGGPTNRRL